MWRPLRHNRPCSWTHSASLRSAPLRRPPCTTRLVAGFHYASRRELQLTFFSKIEKKSVFGTYHDLDDICANPEQMETPCCDDLLLHIQGHLYIGALATLSQANKAYRAAVRSTLSCRRMVHIWARMRMMHTWMKICDHWAWDFSPTYRFEVLRGVGGSGKSTIGSALRRANGDRILPPAAARSLPQEDYVLSVIERSRLHATDAGRSLAYLVRREETALNRHRRKAKSRGLKK